MIWLPPVTATAESGTGELRQVAQLTRVHALTIGTVLLVGVVVVLHYVALQDVPPGFFSDEASVAYDAKGIETDGRDSHGVLMPVFFQSFRPGSVPLGSAFSDTPCGSPLVSGGRL